MEDNISQMVAATADGDFSAFQQAFENEMNTRMQAAVESKYTTMFSTQESSDD